MNSRKERNNSSPACSPCSSSPARLLVNAMKLVVANDLEFPRIGFAGNSPQCIKSHANKRHDSSATSHPLSSVAFCLPTAVLITIDPVDSWVRKQSSSRTGTVRVSYQLPNPICLHPAIGSMFLTNAVVWVLQVGRCRDGVSSLRRD